MILVEANTRLQLNITQFKDESPIHLSSFKLSYSFNPSCVTTIWEIRFSKNSSGVFNYLNNIIVFLVYTKIIGKIKI